MRTPPAQTMPPAGCSASATACASPITAALNGLVIQDGTQRGRRRRHCVGAGDVLTLTNATVSGNTAGIDGGGIFGGYGAAITLTNATVSGNSA